MPENYSDIFIRDIMTHDVVVVNEDDPVEHIFELFDKYHFNTYPVVNNEGKFTGIIDQDIMLEIIMFHRIPRTKHTHMAAVRSQGESAREIMIPHPVTISPDENLHDAADMMLKHHINRVCVVENDKLVGIISKKNIICEVYKRKEVE
ncbi:MAG: CBS domain-containing protein [Desulfobacterales bacterium]|jgi:CBS domain-containing protein|nr:CBS domain-containing protein [Desulfobacterales bacterium]